MNKGRRESQLAGKEGKEESTEESRKKAHMDDKKCRKEIGKEGI